jgi:hypothetical protein
MADDGETLTSRMSVKTRKTVTGLALGVEAGAWSKAD